jgi:hypothetical protein
MPSFEEGLRHFWLRDIHHIAGLTGEELREWLKREVFVIPQVNGPNDFVLRILAPLEAKTAIAHDSTRMASAAFETMHGISAVSGLPKSTAWILIRAYYAAYFAAHSLLRTLGTVCIQLDGEQTSALDHVAHAFGVLPGTGFESGYYIARYDSNMDEMHFQKSFAARRGSHEILWESFANMLRHVSNHLLTVSAAFNTVALRLSEVENLLRQAGQNSGTWLSQVRNQANYRHEFGLWFPYSASQVSGNDLVRIVRRWKGEPAKLFPVDQSNQVTMHVWLCTIIVSICHAVAIDIESHATRRRCFHTYGSLALTRLMKIR